MAGALWEDLTWPDAERRAGEVGMVIIPGGATEHYGETSCMLALRPDLVHPELAVD